MFKGDSMSSPQEMMDLEVGEGSVRLAAWIVAAFFAVVIFAGCWWGWKFYREYYDRHSVIRAVYLAPVPGVRARGHVEYPAAGSAWEERVQMESASASPRADEMCSFWDAPDVPHDSTAAASVWVLRFVPCRDIDGGGAE